MAATVPIKKTALATGRRNGFWNLLILSIKGTVNNPAGTAAINNTPSNLFGTVRKIWNTGRLGLRYCRCYSLNQNRT